MKVEKDNASHIQNKFWIANHKHVLLLAAAVLLFIAHCWADDGLQPSFFLDGVSTLFLAALIYTLTENQNRLFPVFTVLTSLLILISWGERILFPSLSFLQTSLEAFLYTYGACFGITALIKRKSSSFDDLCSVVSVYFLIGFAFAALFDCIQILDSHSFITGNSAVSEYSMLLYFSLSNLVTLGFGDVKAVAPLGQALTVIEAIIGQFYIAVVVARLVAIHLRDQSK